MPITYGANIPLVPLAGATADSNSDPGGYAIPANVLIEQPAGGDQHAVIVDTATGILHEIFGLAGSPGSWSCGSAAKWDLGSNALREIGWTSADAAGLPILPGILRYEEILAGQITHCLRMSVPHTLYGGSGDAAGYVWPARHYAAVHANVDPAVYPAMGQRFRLQASFDISGFSPNMQIVLKALKKYGVMVADNGLPWAMEMDGDSRWDLTDLATLHNVLGSSLEAVDATALMVGQDSGATGDVGNQVLMTDKLGRPNSVTVAMLARLLGGVAVIQQPPPPIPPEVGSATFVKIDLATAGSWPGVYGKDGWQMAGSGGLAVSAPYAITEFQGQSLYIWRITTSDARGLEKGGTPIDRIAACWFSDTQFSIDLVLTDGKPHQVAIYLLDWDSYGPRSERVDVTDVAGNVLDTRSASGFGGGLWLVWTMSGHVKIVFTNLHPGSNAVVSGIFFG